MTGEKWFSLLGLAYRAGKIASGEEAVLNEIRRRRAKLVILSEDASENTRNRIAEKCNYYHIPYRIFKDRHQLGGAIGKAARVCIAVKDEGFAKGLLSLIDENLRG